MIPVVDVLAEGDDLSARNRLRVEQLLQQRIRRRTAGAAFRREELDENRRRRARRRRSDGSQQYREHSASEENAHDRIIPPHERVRHRRVQALPPSPILPFPARLPFPAVLLLLRARPFLPPCAQPTK